MRGNKKVSRLQLSGQTFTSGVFPCQKGKNRIAAGALASELCSHFSWQPAEVALRLLTFMNGICTSTLPVGQPVPLLSLDPL